MKVMHVCLINQISEKEFTECENWRNSFLASTFHPTPPPPRSITLIVHERNPSPAFPQSLLRKRLKIDWSRSFSVSPAISGRELSLFDPRI